MKNLSDSKSTSAFAVTVPPTLELPSKKLIPLLSICLGFFIVTTDTTIVNISLPNIAQSMGEGIDLIQWVISGYTLAACFLLLAGHLGDKIGAKKICIAGLSLFTVASFACALCNSYFLLITFRFLQGIGGAMIIPNSLSLISKLYDNKKDRARAIGVWGSVGGIAAASGPVIGGIITHLYGWRWIFFINIPIGILAVFLIGKYVKNSSSNKTYSFDFLGQITIIISMATFAFTLIRAGKIGWSENSILIGFFIFAITFILFLIIEWRTKLPMLPLEIFRSRIFSTSTIVGTMLNIGFYGQLFLMPLYFHNIRGYSALITGLAIFPQAALTALSSYLSGRLTGVFGPRIIMVMGIIIASTGFFIMDFIIDNSNISYATFILPLAFIGFGCSFTVPAATISAIHSVDRNRAGIASGAFNISRQLGSLIGVAVFGTIVNNAENFISGMKLSLLICGIGFVIVGLLAVVLIRQGD